MDQGLSIVLKGGQVVNIEAFLFRETYSRVLVCGPEYFQRVNEKIIEALYDEIIWGSRKFHKILPSDEQIASLMPRNACFVWLRSSPTDQRFDGSELVVAWFDDLQANETVCQIVDRKIADLDWHKLAQNFEYWNKPSHKSARDELHSLIFFLILKLIKY